MFLGYPEWEVNNQINEDFYIFPNLCNLSWGDTNRIFSIKLTLQFLIDQFIRKAKATRSALRSQKVKIILKLCKYKLTVSIICIRERSQRTWFLFPMDREMFGSPGPRHIRAYHIPRPTSSRSWSGHSCSRGKLVWCSPERSKRWMWSDEVTGHHLAVRTNGMETSHHALNYLDINLWLLLRILLHSSPGPWWAPPGCWSPQQCGSWDLSVFSASTCQRPPSSDRKIYFFIENYISCVGVFGKCFSALSYCGFRLCIPAPIMILIIPHK